MKPPGEIPLGEWADRLDALIESEGVTVVKRARVFGEVASTQDTARDAGPGVLIACDKQTEGRGRLGRSWDQSNGLGLAATFAIDGSSKTDAELSLASGLALCKACEGALGTRSVARPMKRMTPTDAALSAMSLPIALASLMLKKPAPIGLRWPNDVVETNKRTARKVGGVLIERSGDTALIGFGVNVLQAETDWPDELLTKAASLRQLRSHASRFEVLGRLMLELEEALGLSSKVLAQRWAERDVLTGTTQTFTNGNERVTGSVLAVRPSSDIMVRVQGGRKVRLPAETTSLVHNDEGV
ncbi:MAG: hypothetical protein AAGB51_14590 [Planctomycetota bacterium]